MKTKLCIAVSLLGLLFYLGNPTSLVAQQLHVPDDYISIQTAIRMASDGDIVIVAEGTYYEQIDFQGKAITLASKYYLDGDKSHIEKTIIDGSYAIDENHASVVYFISGEDESSVLCGFTIQNGKGTYDDFYQAKLGGGILCMSSGATIIDNRIINNKVVNNHRACGAGIAARDVTGEKLLILRNNYIQYNYTENHERYPGFSSGAGIDIEGIEFEISNNTISDNLSKGRVFGVGITIYDCMGLIQNNEILSNIGYIDLDYGYGGGIYVEKNWPGIVISDNLISSNVLLDKEAISVWGGGICLLNTYDNYYSDILIDRNMIEKNEAQNGGGIFITRNMNSTVVNNIIMRNHASNFGGGILLNNAGRSFDQGMGRQSILPAFYSSQEKIPALINNTVTLNTTDGYGGGIGCTIPHELLAFNNILCSNSAKFSGDAIYLSQVKTAHLYHNRIAEELIDGSGYWEGSGNICGEPDMDASCHLNWNSTCANAGINSIKINDVWYYSPETDFDLDERPYLNTMPDIGADESTVLYVNTNNINKAGVKSMQVWPNPITISATVMYEVVSSGNVSCIIYNARGELIDVLVSEQQTAGQHSYYWNPSNLPSGIYYCTLKTESGVQTNKIVKLK